MNWWLMYRLEDGAEAMRVQSQSAAAPYPSDGFGVIEVPAVSLNSIPADLDAIKAFHAVRIDELAEVERDVRPGQALTYLRKEAEARSIKAKTGDPAPMLEAEAKACGMNIDELADAVIAAVDEVVERGAQIEAARRSAKLALIKADNLAAISKIIDR